MPEQSKSVFKIIVPENVQKEIDALPENDNARLTELFRQAKFGLHSMKFPTIKKFEGDIWYFRAGAARAFYVSSRRRNEIYLLRVFRKQSQNMPRKERKIVNSRREAISL